MVLHLKISQRLKDSQTQDFNVTMYDDDEDEDDDEDGAAFKDINLDLVVSYLVINPSYTNKLNINNMIWTEWRPIVHCIISLH